MQSGSIFFVSKVRADVHQADIEAKKTATRVRRRQQHLSLISIPAFVSLTQLRPPIRKCRKKVLQLLQLRNNSSPQAHLPHKTSAKYTACCLRSGTACSSVVIHTFVCVNAWCSGCGCGSEAYNYIPHLGITLIRIPNEQDQRKHTQCGTSRFRPKIEDRTGGSWLSCFSSRSFRFERKCH